MKSRAAFVLVFVSVLFFLFCSPSALAQEALTLGVPVTGSLSGSGDEVMYSVDVNAGQHLTVVLDATEFNLYDYELYISHGALPTTAIYDARGELPNADQAVEVANTQAGTYYVLVRSASGGGAYTLVAHTSSTFPTLPLCGPRTGALQGSGDVKLYQVVVPAGEHLTVVLDGSPDLYQYDLYIRYGALPTTVVYDGVGDGTGADQSVQVAPTQAGTYYLMIRSASGGGSYVIGVQGFCHRILLPMIVRDR